MDDESIVPKRHVTPILRADATDDNLDVAGNGQELEDGWGGLVKGPVMVCPICVLETCGHNLAKIPREAD